MCGTVLILYMMSLQFDECPTNVTVKVFFCDNAQVVSRSNDMDYIKVKVSEYNVLDYDLWKLTQEVQSLIPFVWNINGYSRIRMQMTKGSLFMDHLLVMQN
mmetsp:Transcript_6417/g.6919  ORF Transcript_6417/g.6919 Transcript_6417/m.6919 type:complete len:101 (+) Transcript_6417:593-895(+)